MHRETLCRRRRKHQDQNREEVSTTEHNDPHSPTEHQPICTVQPYCQVGLASSRSLGGDWRCRPGRAVSLRSWSRWTDQLRNDTALHLFLPTSGDRPSYGAMVEQRDRLSWLHDDDDDELYCKSSSELPCRCITGSATTIHMEM